MATQHGRGWSSTPRGQNMPIEKKDSLVITFWVMATQIFVFIVHPEKLGDSWSNLTVAYFSDGLFNHQLEEDWFFITCRLILLHKFRRRDASTPNLHEIWCLERHFCSIRTISSQSRLNSGTCSLSKIIIHPYDSVNARVYYFADILFHRIFLG